MTAKKPYKIAIIGAGASGLMAADFLAQQKYRERFDVHVYEQMPTAGRKILMAGKSGLNLSHSEPLEQFQARYTPKDWLAPHIECYSNRWLVAWLNDLGVQTFIGSSGRIFPVEMKASKFLRQWLSRLTKQGVTFHYRHSCKGIEKSKAAFCIDGSDERLTEQFCAIILACGGRSWARLGSDGNWVQWFDAKDITQFYPSNVGVFVPLSGHIAKVVGSPIKGIAAWVDDDKSSVFGDMTITHYGLESGVIYPLNAAIRRELQRCGRAVLKTDLLPHKPVAELSKVLSVKKQSLTTRLKKAGLDNAKMALLLEFMPKSDWQDSQKVSCHIKSLAIPIQGFRPIDEAISTGGGIKRQALTGFQMHSNPYLFCTGEMLDWDAPTGGYLLTACFALGRGCAKQVATHLDTKA